MFRQLVIVGLLFAVGVSFGAVFTPVDIDTIEDQEPAPVQQQRPQSNKDEQTYLS